MNLKKLAILLGVTILCSFADAKATIKVRSKQSAVSSVKTPEVQASANLDGGQGINESVPSGGLYVTSSGSDQKFGGDEGPNTNVFIKIDSQGDAAVRANLP